MRKVSVSSDGAGASSSSDAGGGAKESLSGKGDKMISYSADRIIGNGSFGVVFQATMVESGEIVAIKKVLQNKRFKNRELQIMRQLKHPNIVDLKHCFYSDGDKPDELYLNLVLEYIPETVYRIGRQYQRSKQPIPLTCVKLYVYQLCRALAHIHALRICHRDIKPQNLLVDNVSHRLALCDFGSAKVLVRGEPNVAYICSRYYRAPELIFGATDYTTAIDVWSLGCVVAELFLGQPLFPGENGVDQLVEIIKVLGTPGREDINTMNPNYTEFKFPQITKQPWAKLFSSSTPKDGVDLVSSMLQYRPAERLTALEACTHPFFDSLREEGAVLPSGEALPPLFNFTAVELSSNPDLAEKLVPEWARQGELWPPPKFDPSAARRLIGAAKDGPRKSRSEGQGAIEGAAEAAGGGAAAGGAGGAGAGAGAGAAAASSGEVVESGTTHVTVSMDVPAAGNDAAAPEDHK